MDLRVVELRKRDDGRFEERPAPTALPDRSVTVLDVYGSLLYAGARTLEARLPNPSTAASPVVVLRLRGRTSLGATALTVLRNYARQLKTLGGHLFLSGVDPNVVGIIRRTGRARRAAVRGCRGHANRRRIDGCRLRRGADVVGEPRCATCDIRSERVTTSRGRGAMRARTRGAHDRSQEMDHQLLRTRLEGSGIRLELGGWAYGHGKTVEEAADDLVDRLRRYAVAFVPAGFGAALKRLSLSGRCWTSFGSSASWRHEARTSGLASFEDPTPPDPTRAWIRGADGRPRRRRSGIRDASRYPSSSVPSRIIRRAKAIDMEADRRAVRAARAPAPRGRP